MAQQNRDIFPTSVLGPVFVLWSLAKKRHVILKKITETYYFSKVSFYVNVLGCSQDHQQRYWQNEV